MSEEMLRGGGPRQVTEEHGVRRSSQVWREMVLWSIGTALMVALSGGLRKHELSKAWVVSHSSRGERPEASEWTLRRRSPGSCVVAKLVVCPGHEIHDFLDTPTRVVAYEATTGETVWSISVSDIVTRLAVQDNHVIVVLSNGTILSIDAAAGGRTRWVSRVLTIDTVSTSEVSSAAIDFESFGESSLLFVAISSPTRAVRLTLSSGAVQWSASSSSSAAEARNDSDQGLAFSHYDTSLYGPLQRPENAWEAEARFWSSTSYSQESSIVLGVKEKADWTELRDLQEYVTPPYTDTIVIISTDHTLVRLRTLQGLEVWRNGSWIILGLPPAALIADFDRDCAIDTVAVVDTNLSPPKLLSVNTEYAPPCIAVSTRGSPPTERFLELALCRDVPVEKELELRRRAERRGHGRPVYSAPPLALPRLKKDKNLPPLTAVLSSLYADLVEIESTQDDQQLDIVFAVSRGVVTRVSASGALRWQNRKTPSWSAATGGYILSLRSLLLVQGQSKLALLDADSGTIVTSTNLPSLWDDELPLSPPVTGATGGKQANDLILVTTQFQTIAFTLTSTKLGHTFFRIIILLAALALPFLARALKADDDDDLDRTDQEYEDERPSFSTGATTSHADLSGRSSTTSVSSRRRRHGASQSSSVNRRRQE